MMGRWLRRLQQWVTWRRSLVLLAALVLASLALFNVGWIPYLESLSGERLLDSRFIYSAEDVYRTLGLYGPEGRQIYTRYLLWIDLLYGTLAGITFFALFLVLGKTLRRVGGPVLSLSLLPVLMTLLDYGEGALLLLVLGNYPNIVIPLASFASLLTTLKLITVYLSILLLMAGILAVLVMDRQQQRPV